MFLKIKGFHKTSLKQIMEKKKKRKKKKIK